MDKKEKEASSINGFDFAAFEKEAAKQLKAGKSLSGKDGVLTPLIKRIIEQALQGELESNLETEQEEPNRRNGKTSKTMKSEHGPFELETPRDRNGTFEPEIVRKRQTSLGNSVENKLIALYGLGMSYADISGHMEDLYGLEVSPAMLSAITDKIIPVVKE
jgi:putative transposase